MFCFPYAQVSLLLEAPFSRLNSPFSNGFSEITGGKPGFSQALSWFLFQSWQILHAQFYFPFLHVSSNWFLLLTHTSKQTGAQ